MRPVYMDTSEREGPPPTFEGLTRKPNTIPTIAVTPTTPPTSTPAPLMNDANPPKRSASRPPLSQSGGGSGAAGRGGRAEAIRRRGARWGGAFAGGASSRASVDGAGDPSDGGAA